jgi:hypothetical protein
MTETARNKDSELLQNAGQGDVRHEFQPNASLSNLDQPPLFRGAIDTFDCGILKGWALSAQNPLRSVALELWLAGVRVARLTTGEQRTDIAQLVGLPVKSGFEFDLERVMDSGARDALLALKEIKTANVYLKDILMLRIEGTNYELPAPTAHGTSEVALEPIISKLQRAAGVNFGNQRVALRNELLDISGFVGPEDEPEVRVIAYYLPQFHPFAENDEWWGKGFTEWTNVTTAKPFFKDHYQPHIPADMGYYDLRLDQVQRDQIALAKRYGVTGFCYYYYWFSGKTLMTMPIDRHVEQDMDMDFCLCWANESWSRRWDGSENDVLIGQRHTYDSDVDFIRSCLPYFRSKRYIKIDGAPLLQIYRISLMECPRETLECWREIVRAEGFPDLHVSMVESFGLTDPYEYGCDSSSQFPPHGVVGDCVNPMVEELAQGFSGTIYSYAEIVRGEIARPAPAHTRFRAAMPSWDNTARKGAAGNVFYGATPALFETWIRHLVADTRQRLPEGKRFVFVNAWNEWAEGTHLEPDRKYGHANLRAIRNALVPEARALAPLLPPSDGSEDRLAETRQQVQRLIVANRELTRLVSQVKFGMRVGEEICFSLAPKTLLKLKPAKNVDFNIDAINGRGLQPQTTIPLSTSQGLGLKGWFLHNRAPASFLMVSLRSNMPGQDDRRYLALIPYFEPREDVMSYFEADANTLCSGFNLRASLRGMPAGSYEIELICPDSVSAISGFVTEIGISIMIG